MTDKIIPVGNSIPPAIFLAIISAISTSIAPKIATTGINFLWSVPTKNLAICGIIKPTKPKTPLTYTTKPITKDIKIIYSCLYFSKLTPKDRETSSPKSIKFKILYWVIKNRVHNKTKGPTIIISFHLAPATEPNNQNITCLAASLLLDRYISKLEKLDATVEIASPDKINFVDVALEPRLEIKSTKKDVAIAPTKAIIPIELQPNILFIPITTAKETPKLAPLEIPKT